MKTGDETVDSMFDEVVETTIKADGTAQVKRLVSDEETEFAEACDALVAAENMWAKIDKRAKAQERIPDNVGEWFDGWRRGTKPTSVSGFCSSEKTAASGRTGCTSS